MYQSRQSSGLSLSPKAIDFLKAIFKRYSQEDGLTLKISSFKEIFYPISDNSIPWSHIEDLVPLEDHEILKMDSWLLLWK